LANFISLQDVGSKELLVNADLIKSMSMRNTEHVNLYFDEDHIVVVRGPINEILEKISNT
jgi:hypothetical protein